MGEAVRKATSADTTAVATTLASAFGEDPVFRWMSGVPDCERRMTPFWRNLARVGLRKDDHEIYVFDDGAAAAVWRGVDDWKVSFREMLGSAPAVLAAMRHRVLPAMRLLSAMEKAHPQEPHYYLEFLGTRRDRQGAGLGTTVLAPMLERCDAEGMPAYLESSNRRNVPFYVRHGFVERGEVRAPGGAPAVVPMWREPRG
jgi:GNAT superfamily N-acetyltransferase